MENWYKRYRQTSVGRRLNSYTAYSIRSFVIWAVLLAAVAALASDGTKEGLFLIFFGWVIGWLSATIARSVYPHPGARQS